MERRLGRDPFAQSGLDKIFTPVVEQATTPITTPAPASGPAPVSAPASPSKPEVVKPKPAVKTGTAVKSRPVTAVDSSTSSRGLPQGWTRATFIIRQDLVRKVKRAAYWDRRQIKDLVSEALDAYLAGKKTD